MNLKESVVGPATVLALEGRLDTTGGPLLEQRVIDLVAAGSANVILECAALTYISSAGLRAILVASKKAMAAGGALSIAAPSDVANEIFEIAGLVKVLTVYPTLEAALSSVRARG